MNIHYDPDGRSSANWIGHIFNYNGAKGTCIEVWLDGSMHFYRGVELRMEDGSHRRVSSEELTYIGPPAPPQGATPSADEPMSVVRFVLHEIEATRHVLDVFSDTAITTAITDGEPFTLSDAAAIMLTPEAFDPSGGRPQDVIARARLNKPYASRWDRLVEAGALLVMELERLHREYLKDAVEAGDGE